MTQDEKEVLKATLAETRKHIKQGDLDDVWDVFSIFENVLTSMIYKKSK